MSSSKRPIHTDRAPTFDQTKFPFSQAISYGGVIYCSGNIGIDPAKKALVEGSITERTVSFSTPFAFYAPPCSLKSGSSRS
jgi:2-iminobutanoate/2-iminopropanoate deaminase